MLLDFWFSFFVLSVLRLNRHNTLWTAVSSMFLVILASAASAGVRDFLQWLSVAAWVTTFAGVRNRSRLVFAPLLLPLIAAPAGLVGLLTGLMLNLPFPQLKCRPVKETYGIYRVLSC